MKAAVRTEYGGPEVVRIEEVDKPSPAAGEVLVKVYASTVNRTDCGFRSASPWIVRFFSGLRRPKVSILGSEFAGEVEALGAGVSEFAEGDRVFGFRDDRFGGHGEYLTMNEDSMIAKIPGGLSYQEAAPILEGAHYALFYIRGAKIASGQRVLVNGATGAIGSSALQIIKHLGAHVTAVCRGDKVDLMRSLGADEVIDYESEDFTVSEGLYDVVFDSVGKSHFGACKGLLKPGGIYTSSELGPRWENPFLALWTAKFGDKKVLFPLPKSLKEDALYLADLVEQGAYKPLIDRVYPLDEIADAYRYVETGGKIGNVVIEVRAEEPGTG